MKKEKQLEVITLCKNPGGRSLLPTLLNYDIIETYNKKFPLHIHYGIYYNGRIYHNSVRYRYPIIDTWAGFMNGDRFAVRRLYRNYINGSQNPVILFNKLRDRRYTYLLFNCEDFVNKYIGRKFFFRGKVTLVSCVVFLILKLLFVAFLIHKSL